MEKLAEYELTCPFRKQQTTVIKLTLLKGVTGMPDN